MEKLFLALLVGLTVFAGCGGDEPADEPVPDEDVTTDEPVTAELSDTIVLPDGWEMIDAISVEDIEELLGAEGYDTWHEPLSDAAAGKPQLSYYDTTRTEGASRNRSKINFLVYTFDGQSNFDRVSGYVNESEEVEGELWDRAIVGLMGGGIDDITVGMLVLRGDVCIRIKWSPEEYPDKDNIEFSVQLAELVINNLYGNR